MKVRLFKDRRGVTWSMRFRRGYLPRLSRRLDRIRMQCHISWSLDILRAAKRGEIDLDELEYRYVRRLKPQDSLP